MRGKNANKRSAVAVLRFLSFGAQPATTTTTTTYDTTTIACWKGGKLTGTLHCGGYKCMYKFKGQCIILLDKTIRVRRTVESRDTPVRGKKKEEVTRTLAHSHTHTQSRSLLESCES